jgi:hypothetical protein
MVFHETEEFQQLKHQFKGETVLPTDAGYRQVLAQREAGVVAYPKDANDV